MQLLDNLKHRLFGKGNHIDNGSKVTITKFINTDEHQNIFEVKKHTLNWCKSCRVTFGYPEKDHQYDGLLMAIAPEHYVKMIGNRKKRVVLYEFSDGSSKVEYH